MNRPKFLVYVLCMCDRPGIACSVCRHGATNPRRRQAGGLRISYRRRSRRVHKGACRNVAEMGPARRLPAHSVTRSRQRLPLLEDANRRVGEEPGSRQAEMTFMPNGPYGSAGVWTSERLSAFLEQSVRSFPWLWQTSNGRPQNVKGGRPNA